MRKLLLGFCLLCISLAAQAQFEQGKWIINPSVTGLSLSHNEQTGTEFGIAAKTGAFVADNVALMVTLGADWTKYADAYTAGAGARYYFDKIGLYVGADLLLGHLKPDGSGSVTNYSTTAEVGYAFFITKSVTLEPAAYYNLSFKDSDYSQYGIKLGFGIYF